MNAYHPDEKFARNSRINADIHRILQKFPCSVQIRMLKPIRDARNLLDHCKPEKRDDADAKARHLFREFVVGEYLNDNGYVNLEYETAIDSKTPDWLDRTAKLLVEVFTTERNGSDPPKNRTVSNLRKKMRKYESIVKSYGFHCIIAIHPDFFVGADLDDFREWFGTPDIWNELPHLAGIIYFAETVVIGSRQVYHFELLKRL